MKDINQLLNFSLINIDKPSGPTSFQISQFIKNTLKLSKTSHMGTLDPQVSGVLPVTLGRACKLSEYFMHKDKEYVGIMRIHEEIPEEKLKEELKNFIGKIIQLPPVRSRVKRQEREREIKTFEILEIDGKDILFKTQVEAGTYIRKLIHDLGEKIGGAHMLELRRTKAGIFDEKTAITLYEFEKAVKEDKLEKYLVPAEDAIKKVLPFIQISDKNLKQILTGKPLMNSDISEKTLPEKFAVFCKERFVGIYKKFSESATHSSAEAASAEGDIVAKAEFVYN
jgi:H/ACA ribonucleoprotein complex subunit 4